MKRSKPLKADPTKVREWQQHSRKPLKQGRTASERPVLSAATMSTVIQLTGFCGLCQCGCGRPADPTNPACWHHVLPKQRYPELIDNPLNLLIVAVQCHSNHEVAFARLPRKAVWRAELLPLTDQMRSYLERTYGPRP